MKKKNLLGNALSKLIESQEIGNLSIEGENVDFWDYLDLVTNLLQALKALKTGDWDVLLKEIIEIKDGVEVILSERSED